MYPTNPIRRRGHAANKNDYHGDTGRTRNISDIIRERTLATGQTISLRRGDLTVEDADAIVNAANTMLQHGGGLAGAISRAGGPEIQRESNRIGFTDTGTAAATGAGNLPAKCVIHAVGPVWNDYDEEEADRLLASAVQSALEIASARELDSIAIPAISSGIYGFPKDRCAVVLLKAVLEYLVENPETPPHDIRFVVLDTPTVKAFERAWDEGFGYQDD